MNQQNKRNVINQSNAQTYQQPQTSQQQLKPFEITSRIEVNLPYNQKTAVRVKLDITLEELLNYICKETANFDKSRYDLIINGQRPESMLDAIASYNTKEVTLLLKNLENNSSYLKNLSKKNNCFFF